MYEGWKKRLQGVLVVISPLVRGRIDRVRIAPNDGLSLSQYTVRSTQMDHYFREEHLDRLSAHCIYIVYNAPMDNTSIILLNTHNKS
jgi:hypothetical protein